MVYKNFECDKKYSLNNRMCRDFGFHSFKNDKNELIILLLGGDAKYRADINKRMMLLYNYQTNQIFVKKRVL